MQTEKNPSHLGPVTPGQTTNFRKTSAVARSNFLKNVYTICYS
jgi:hypothetical protein